MSLSANIPILILIFPLLMAFIVILTGWKQSKFGYPLAIIALALSMVSATGTLLQVLQEGPFQYRLGNWPPPFGITYQVDHLNAIVLLLVTTVALISVIFSKKIVEQEMPDKATYFYCLYLLLVTGLLGITVTGDAFNLYVLLEISALTGYALIALGRGRAYMATFNYVIMGTVGASLYLLGVGYLYIKTGTLNMADLYQRIAAIGESNTILVAFILIMLGVWIKMGFFPLHSWLPNAYTYAPNASSCLIAPLMTKVMVYVMIRMMFSVFTPHYVFDTLAWSSIIVWLAVIAIVTGSLYALAQTNLKKMLAYIIVAEVGYMVGGVWLATRNGITGAIYHILSDALMTLCLFMAVAIITYKTGGYAFSNLKGLFRKMPVTMTGFTIGALSMIGVPPTCGFLSKWYLISGAIDTGAWGFGGALIFSSLVNVLLFFRIIEIAYFEPLHDAHGSEEHHAVSIDEAPLSMLVPLLIVAGGILVLGFYAGDIIENIVHFAVPEGI